MAYQLRKREKLLQFKDYLLELALEKETIALKIRNSTSAQISILLFFLREVFSGAILVPKSTFEIISKRKLYRQLRSNYESDNLNSLKTAKKLAKFANIIGTLLDILL